MEVYIILHGHASAGRRAYIHVVIAREDARASKQGEVTADDSHDGYLCRARLSISLSSGPAHGNLYTYTPAEANVRAPRLTRSVGEDKPLVEA